MLQERRLQKLLTGAVVGGSDDAIAAAIRDRTKLTLKQAFSKPDSGADLGAAREAELRRQLIRIEDLRRTYDTMHAELVNKETLKRMQELEFATDKIGDASAPGSPASPREQPTKAKAHAQPVVPQPPPGKPPAQPIVRRPPRPPPTDATLGGPVPPITVSGSGFGDEEVTRSLTDIMWEGPTQAALEEMSKKVDEAAQTLGEMQHDCEVYAHMELRTFEANHKLGGEIDDLRHVMKELAVDEERLRELEEEAQQAARKARRALAEAKAAHAEQQRSYEEIKSNTSQVVADKQAKKKREEAFKEGEKNAFLDGAGELDEAGEEALKREALDMQTTMVAATLEKEAATAEEARLDAVFQRIRRATHDPESISTPQNLVIAVLSAKDRGEELQAQVGEGEDLLRVLGEERDRAKAELSKHMYGINSSTQAAAEAEREVEPGIRAAESLMETRHKKQTDARSLVVEAKQGLALLMHLALGDGMDKPVTDAEVPTALERVERHLLACLQIVNAPPPPAYTRRGGAADKSGRAATPNANNMAERAAALAAQEEEEAAAVVAAEEAAEVAAVEAAVAEAAEAAEAAAAAEEAATVARRALAAVAAKGAANEPGSPKKSTDEDADDYFEGAPAAPTKEEAALVDAMGKADKAATAAKAKAKEKAAAAEATKEAKAAKEAARAAPKSPASTSPRSKDKKDKPPEDLREVGAKILSARFANNVRVITEEEMEAHQEHADWDDEEGVDSDGTELTLTRRLRMSSSDETDRKKRKSTAKEADASAKGKAKGGKGPKASLR